MNTANLQLEGLNLIIGLHEALIAKGVVARDELITTLHKVDQTDGNTPPFSELAKMVGQTKDPYNVQR